jgi:hypothetical protein
MDFGEFADDAAMDVEAGSAAPADALPTSPAPPQAAMGSPTPTGAAEAMRCVDVWPCVPTGLPTVGPAAHPLAWLCRSSPACSPIASPPQQAVRKTQRQAMQTFNEAEAGFLMAPVVAAPAEKSFAAGAGSQLLEEDGSLNMFWFDIHEEKYADPGTLYLFGKVQTPDKAGFMSCCVKVTGCDRNMYVVPRKFLQNAAGNATEEEVELLNFENENCVYLEFSERMKSRGISVAGCVKATPAPRMCTFDDDNNIPRGIHECLKYKCPSDVKEIPADVRNGRSYVAITGCESTCIEQFLIRQKIMGASLSPASRAQPH